MRGAANEGREPMLTLTVFNNVSADGYFTDRSGDMSWAHRKDPEWDEFAAGNAGGQSTLLFGRVTYQMMAGFWPTPQAKEAMPEVAEGMNRLPKVVFSRTLETAAWNNTRVVRGSLAGEVRNLKRQDGPGMVILGSGTIVSQLAEEGLVDEFQLVVVPTVLGGGRTLFETVRKRLPLQLAKSRTFGNGNVLLSYRPLP